MFFFCCCCCCCLRMGAFLCQHETSKIKKTVVRNSFSAVVYTACNITHAIEKPIAALSVSSEDFFPLLLHERAPLTVYYCDYIYPHLPKTTLPTSQSPFTKSNDSTVTTHHVPFNFDQFNTSLNYVYKYLLSIRYC